MKIKLHQVRNQTNIDATIDGKKTVSFGAKGYSDFTQHKVPARKQRYLNRQKTRENWADPTTAGSLSKNVLWNKQSITASIKDMDKQFKNYKIKYAP